MKKIHCLGYGPTQNIGDEIQTLAAKQALAKLGFEFGGLVDRGGLVDHDTSLNGARVNLLINGFIPHGSLDKLINHPHINPIFTNLHLAGVKEDKLGNTMEQLKKFAPIGCRDRWTTELLQSHGVESFFNYCMTLTFDRRLQAPANGKVILVDERRRTPDLTAKLGQDTPVLRTHFEDKRSSREVKFARAQKLLDEYRDEAKLVITSRLHCALPCIAMGVPVIMRIPWPQPRLDLAKEFIPIHRCYFYHNVLPLKTFYDKLKFPARVAKKAIIKYINYRSIKTTEWNPQPLEIEDTKQQIINKVEEQIKLRAI